MALSAVTAQRNPSAANLEDAYTVPALKKFEGTVIACNRAAVATTFRVSLALAGAADDPKQYIAYDRPANPNDDTSTKPFAIPAGTVVRVYATLATITFSVTGLEGDA
jgi:hypothetical protein